MKITTVKLKDSTKDVLASCGAKGETFDEIISRVCAVYQRYVKEIEAK